MKPIASLEDLLTFSDSADGSFGYRDGAGAERFVEVSWGWVHWFQRPVEWLRACRSVSPWDLSRWKYFDRVEE